MKNGESTNEVYNRVVEFLKDLRKQSVPIDEKVPNILIVAHGGTIHDLIPAIFAEIKTEEMLSKFFSTLKKNNFLMKMVENIVFPQILAFFVSIMFCFVFN